MSSMDTFDGKILELGNKIGSELTNAIIPMKKSLHLSPVSDPYHVREKRR
jgi:hypothetical protein